VSKSEQNLHSGFAERGTSYTDVPAFSGNKRTDSSKGFRDWKPLPVWETRGAVDSSLIIYVFLFSPGDLQSLEDFMLYARVSF